MIMKTRHILFGLASVAMMTIAGCETAETTVTNTEVNYEELYQKTLVKTYDFIKNVDFDAEYDDCYMGIFEALLTLGDEGINAIEYVIKDINKDNVPELLIGSFDKHETAYTNNDIYAIYSIINNKATTIVKAIFLSSLIIFSTLAGFESLLSAILCTRSENSLCPSSSRYAIEA